MTYPWGVYGSDSTSAVRRRWLSASSASRSEHGADFNGVERSRIESNQSKSSGRWLRAVQLHTHVGANAAPATAVAYFLSATPQKTISSTTKRLERVEKAGAKQQHCRLDTVSRLLWLWGVTHKTPSATFCLSIPTKKRNQRRDRRDRRGC